MMSKKFKIFVHVALIFFSLIMFFPFIWMFLTSIKTYEEAIRVPLQFFPAEVQWVNYEIVFNKFPFATLYFNTIIVTIFTVLGQLAIVSMAAYAFARLRFPGQNVIFVLMLGIIMVPGQIFLIPQFKLMSEWGLTNTLVALVLPSLFSVFGVFLLRQFLRTLPKELDEAALIDGCNYFQIYYKIMLPNIVPGLVSLGILTMLSTWKNLMWPIIVNRSMDMMTLSAGLAMLIGEHTTYYEQVMAGAVISVLPMIVIFMIFQKQFVEGIANTGVKG